MKNILIKANSIKEGLMKKILIGLAILIIGGSVMCSGMPQNDSFSPIVGAASAYCPAVAGGMVVFWYADTGQYLASYGLDIHIVDNGDTWTIYKADGTIIWKDLEKWRVDYGYYKYQYIPQELDDTLTPILIYINDLNLEPIDGNDLPKSEHIGKLTAVNPSLAKPATVTRKWMGQIYDVQCLVTQSIVDMWIVGDLNVGDYVLVSYIEEIPNTTEIEVAIVTDKVFESWSW